jgi:hypothetical protein
MTDESMTDEPMTDDAVADDALDEALRQLDAGMELVIDASGARWQMPGRPAIRFAVERGHAEALLRQLSDRFHTRCPQGRRVLTPEPIPPGSRPDGEPEPDRVLYRKWHTVKEIARICGTSHAKAYGCLMDHEEELILRRLPSRSNAHLVRTTLDLAAVLEDLCGATVQIGLDESLDERQPAPQAVTLTEDTYTYQELGDLAKRSKRAAATMVEHHDLETYTEEGSRLKFVMAGYALADAMEAYWDLEVTISEELRSYL